MTIRSVRPHGPAPRAPAPTPLAAVSGLFALVILGGAVFAAATIVPWIADTWLRAMGAPVTTLNVTLLIGGCVALAGALLAFEFARELDREHSLRRAWDYWDTIRRTAFDSLLKPALLAMALALPTFAVLALAFARPELRASAESASIEPLLAGESLSVLAYAAAIATAFVAIRNLSDYLPAGRAYLIKTLAKHAPNDPKQLAAIPVRQLRFYHGVLRLSGAVAFACELAFQVLAFGVVTWGLATAWPGAQLLLNPDDLSVGTAILFWADRVFALIDGQDIFGFTLSPLEPNKAIWAFGLAILFFKLYVIAMTLRLFQDSLNLRPRDISEPWAAALERST